MFESYSKNCHILYFLLMLLLSGFLHAQDKKAIYNVEKTYLHTDRSRYFMGENLWYKAYSVGAYNNLLSSNSNVLYVELISPDSKIIARNKTNLETGLGHGDFNITDSVGLKPGIYQIRAYTNWNRNFGEDFVFKKNIEIIDVFKAHSGQNITQMNPAERKTPKSKNPNTFNIDFFPEGGSLLESVASVVGFKAVDSSGNPVEVKGEVYDSDNELITSFSSTHDGMGKFQMIPIRGKQYSVKVRTQSGSTLQKKLLKSLKQGYLLSFKVFNGKNIVSVNTNQETLLQNPNQELTLVCKARGVPYLESKLKLKESTLSFELPKANVPEGISQITLYDNKSRPQSERLVYFEKEQDLEVKLTADKASYKPNEKAKISVTSKSKSGEVKSASFSLSVTDMNGLEEDKDYGTTISSYFLMESDISGKVHNPNYYFNPNNLKRLEYLDNLLLTQGWRDFLWKTKPKQHDNITYKVEKGITISGRVEQLLGKKPLVHNNIILALMNKKNFNVFNATTDSLGIFKFEDLVFSGKTNLYLNTTNEKGKFRGEIFLDSLDQEPMAVTFKRRSIHLSDTRTVVENMYRKYAGFGVQPENVLDEIEIIAKKKNDAVVLYGIPDYSYLADENTNSFFSISDILQQNMPFIDRGAHVLIDGYPTYDKFEIMAVSLDEIEKIEAVRSDVAKMYYGEEGRQGIISIFTNRYKRTGNKPKKVPVYSIKKEIEGFYKARIFYVANPDNDNLENDKKEAVRNTIYWNPYVHPDKTGHASVSYYNTNIEAKVKVTLEGITSNGIPVVKNTYYTIEK